MATTVHNFGRRRKLVGVGMASALIAALTLLSRLIGLVRVRIFASTFGAGQVLDTYYAAFRIPDFLMGVLIVGTLSIAALPVLSQYLLESEDKARRLIANLLNWTALCMALLCGLAALAAPWLVRVVVPGFSGEQLQDTITLTRVILAAEVLLSVGNVTATALNALKKFFWAGFAPITYNLGLIAGVVWFYPRYGIAGLGYGVLLGAFVHVATQLFDLFGSGFYFQRVFSLDAGMRAICRLYVPRLLTLDLSQVSLLLASIFGSFLASGSIAVFSLGFDLQAVPVGVFAFAIATATFPHLSEHYASKNLPAFIQLLRQSVVRILFFMLPITVWLLLLRAHAVRILYGAGQFGWDDTRATFGILGVLAFSLLGQSLVPLFSRALLARHNTWAPVIANLVSIAINVAVSLLLVPRLGVAGVAAGYAVAVSVNAALLYFFLRPLLARADSAATLSSQERLFLLEAWKIVFATGALAVATYGVLYAVEPLLDTRTWIGLAAQSGAAVLAGSFAYAVFGAAVKLSDAVAFLRFLRRPITVAGKR